MSHEAELIITLIVAILGSSGIWAIIQRALDRRDDRTKMLIGLGHDRVTYLGMSYLERGDWITEDEYENLVDYLYAPYASMGGNGSAKRIIEAIQKDLRIVRFPPLTDQQYDKSAYKKLYDIDKEDNHES